MVSAGTLSIAGTIETSEIDRGLDRIEDGLQNTKAQANSTFGSFSNLSQVTSKVAGHMMTLASVGVGAMTAMATISPQVAPAMARIGNEMRKISFALGDTLRPMFESVANDLIPAIGSAIDRFTPQIQAMVNVGTEGVKDISSVLKGEWDKIDSIVPKTTMALAGAAAGWKLMGPYGLFLGAALGYAVGARSGESNKETLEKEGLEEEDFRGGMEKTGASLFRAQERREEEGEGFLGTMETFFISGDVSDRRRIAGNIFGSGVDVASNFLMDLIERKARNMTDKDRDFSGGDNT